MIRDDTRWPATCGSRGRSELWVVASRRLSRFPPATHHHRAATLSLCLVPHPLLFVTRRMAEPFPPSAESLRRYPGARYPLSLFLSLPLFASESSSLPPLDVLSTAVRAKEGGFSAVRANARLRRFRRRGPQVRSQIDITITSKHIQSLYVKA